MFYAIKETAFAAACMVIAAIVYWSADQIPPSLLAKVSAGLVPKILAVILFSLSLIRVLMVFIFEKKEVNFAESDFKLKIEIVDEHKSVFYVSLIFFVFILLLELEAFPFWISSSLFVFFSTLLLSEKTLRGVIESASAAVISVSVTIFVFNYVFTVFLP